MLSRRRCITASQSKRRGHRSPGGPDRYDNKHSDDSRSRPERSDDPLARRAGARSTTSPTLRVKLRARRADRSRRSNDGLPPWRTTSARTRSTPGASALPRTAELPTRSDEPTHRRHANRVLTAALARAQPSTRRPCPLPTRDHPSTSSRKADVDATSRTPRRS